MIIIVGVGSLYIDDVIVVVVGRLVCVCYCVL